MPPGPSSYVISGALMMISRIATVSDITEPTLSDTCMDSMVNALGVLKPWGLPTTRFDSEALPEKGDTLTPPSLTSLLVARGP